MNGASVIVGFPGPPRYWHTFPVLLNAANPETGVNVINSSNGFDDMNQVWAGALNAYEKGAATHFAMLHSDVFPSTRWLEVLLGELAEHRADMVSVPVAIKDDRGVTSSGIGDPANIWSPYRRFTTRDLEAMPETFGIEHTSDPDKFLLHNTGCFAIDLKNAKWRETDESGNLRAWFDFPTRIERDPDGRWMCRRISEDWFFSLACHKAGLRTMITRKIKTFHRGHMDYPNSPGWGDMETDEDTKDRWGAAAA